MARQQAQFNLRILAAGAALLLGGCSFADEVVWPAVAGDKTNPARSGAQAPAVSSPREVDTLSVTSAAITNTSVGQRIGQIRSDLSALQTRARSNGNAYDQLADDTSAHAAAYHGTKGQIEARLQVGTTPGNPELVARWNQAQVELDQIARDINNMTALSNAIAGDAATASYLLESAQAAFRLTGAVDEDHRQLRILQDETKQTVVVINRLLSELREDMARQTAYLANERSNLTTLSNAIKNGQLFGRSLTTPLTSLSSPGAGEAQVTEITRDTPALVVIRFDRPDVDYETALYTALSKALEARPQANFTLVAVSPAQGDAANVQLSQAQSRTNAERVFQSMSDMGLPPDRVQITATTSTTARTNEVHIYVR